MPSRWYFMRNGQQHGPVSSTRLRELAAAKQIGTDDLLWKDGTDERRPARQVKGLFPDRNATSRVRSPNKNIADDSSIKLAKNDEASASQSRRPIAVFWTIAATLVALTIVIGSFVIWSNRPTGSDSSLTANADEGAVHPTPPTDALDTSRPPLPSDDGESSGSSTTADGRPEPDTDVLERDTTEAHIGAEEQPPRPDQPEAVALAEDQPAQNEAPAEIPDDPPDAPPERVELHDLDEETLSAGFSLVDNGTVAQYVRFGDVDRAVNALAAGQSIEMEREAEAHQAAVESRVYLIRGLPITNVERDNSTQSGLVLTCYTPLKLATLRSGGDDFHGELFDLWLNQANPFDYWYMTKFQTLRPCRDLNEIALVEQNNGILYHREASTTSVMMQLSVEDVDVANALYEGPDQFSIDLIVEGLNYGQLATGQLFFRRDVLQNNGWNCDDMLRAFNVGAVGDSAMPHVWEATEQASMVRARLVSATLRDSSAQILGRYRKEGEIREFIEPPLRRTLDVQATTFIGRPKLSGRASTGISVAAGQTITLRRHGEWRWGRTSRHVGARFLKVAIGESNQTPLEIHTVQQEMEFQTQHSGELFFGIDDPITRDNAGFLRVNIEILRPVESEKPDEAALAGNLPAQEGEPVEDFEFGEWAVSRFDPALAEMSLDDFRQQYPEAERILNQPEHNYEQWRHISVFEDVTATFVAGRMAGLGFTYKYPAEPDRAYENQAALQLELGDPSTDSKEGPGLEDAITALRWLDRPRGGFGVMSAVKSEPIADSTTGAEMFFLHVEVLNVEKLRNARDDN